MNSTTINRQQIAQLATSANGQPWICTLYFVVVGGKFYWLSYPERRHSQDVSNNPKAALAIAIKPDVPVIGLQVEGDVQEVKNIAEVTKVLAVYVTKCGKGKNFVELLKRGSNKHRLYCLTPRKVMLFDEMNSPENPHREITL